MNEFLSEVLGGKSIPEYAAAIFFVLLGILGRLIYQATQRNQASPRTPINFQWSFLIKDNAMRLSSSVAWSLFVLVMALRFTEQVLHMPLSPFAAVTIGFAMDSLQEKFKEASRQILPFQDVSVSAQPIDQPSPQAEKKINPEKPASEQISATPIVQVKQTESQPHAAPQPKATNDNTPQT